MGNLKLNIFDKYGKELRAKKLDPNDTEVKSLIEETIKAQEKILSLKHVSRESLRSEITI